MGIAAGLVASCIASMTSCLQPVCDDMFVSPSYRITVSDGATAVPICNAQVTVAGNAAHASATDCSYSSGIPTGVETVTIRATLIGYESASQQVSTAYDSDECGHPMAKQVKLTLQPK